jgi:transaldolase
MQFYVETADPTALREALQWRVVEGVVTTPEMLARAGRDLGEVLRELLSLVPGPVFAEVTAQDTASMVAEAKSLDRIDERLVVRVPCNAAGVPAIAELTDSRVYVDASLCFSVTQALVAAKAGARVLSVPVAATDSAGADGLSLVGNVLTVLDQFELKASVIATSVVHPLALGEMARMGVDAASFEPGLLPQLVDHPLTEAAREHRLGAWRRGQN